MWICETCGATLAIGDWPFCPHGRSALAVVPDDVPGGFVVENGFDTPRRFDSHSAHRQALADEGLEIRAKWAGPNDRYLTRWDSVDLDGTRALLERHAAIRAGCVKAQQALSPAVITVRDGDVFRAGDLDDQ